MKNDNIVITNRLTVRELIEILKQHNPESNVSIYEPITGMIIPKFGVCVDTLENLKKKSKSKKIDKTDQVNESDVVIL